MDWLCAIDEAGCLGKFDPSINGDSTTPLIVINALFIQTSHLEKLNRDFANIKLKAFKKQIEQLGGPNIFFDAHRYEVKGADLRGRFRDTKTGRSHRNLQKLTLSFLDKIMGLIKHIDIRLVAQIAVKKPGVDINRDALYCSAIQYIFNCFQDFLKLNGSRGLVIADSRNHGLNVGVSHSICTQKLQSKGDPYPNILTAPLFAHSDNHASIQISDIMASAILFPMASHTFLKSLKGTTCHYNDKFNQITDRYCQQIKALQYRYQNQNQSWQGGIKVTNHLNGGQARDLF